MGEADFVSFQHVEYSSRGGGGGNGAGGIVLYMPAPSPGVSNANSWSSSNETFQGPIGQFKKNLAYTLGDAVAGTKDFSLDKFTQGVSDTVEKFKSTKVGPIARQFGMVAAGRATGMSANQIMSLTQGEIYNPNVEMFYSGPQLRGFTFTFRCAPKDSGDAQAIRQIVREFKMYSAPKVQGDKYKLPHVWDISYGGKAKQYMNKFKTSALTSIDVTYNAGLDSHMTFTDGSPIVTGFTLNFLGTELITQDDNGDY